ncbi:1-aminocyclopropane-1-carboxylate oxidase homolog 1 [Linum perenne]
MVEKIRDASGSWGFFQIVNHGVPKNIQEDMTSGVRNFFDLDLEQKKDYYAREQTKKVMYSSNPDMYAIPVCSWTDLMLTHMSADDPLEPEELPECCRDIVPKYSAEMARVGDLLFQLLSEALGLESNYLKEIDCVEAMGYAYHYYPPCPQPELALGCVHHTDIDFLTVILQDQVGGLQVLRHNSWIDVPYVPGALVVNIGDMLQLISNDKFISALHRVRAKNAGPRISIATFFGHGSTKSTRLYGPIKELVSEKDPPKEIVPIYTSEMNKLGELLFELLSEGLGLESGRLKDMGCLEAVGFALHYYPACPQPELAIGFVEHTDIDFLTVILQDEIGGLQVKHHNSWIDVPCLPGAMVVNIGDMLQLISNDRYISALHRVKAQKVGPRLTNATFFGHATSSNSTRMYAPIEELVSENDPAKYKGITIGDFFRASYKKGVDGTSLLPRLKVDSSVEFSV